MQIYYTVCLEGQSCGHAIGDEGLCCMALAGLRKWYDAAIADCTPGAFPLKVPWLR